MGERQRAFLDGFARLQAFIDEFLNLGNGWFLFLSMGAAYVVLQLLQLLDIVTQEAVAILFTFAVILGADLYLFVVVGKARGAWMEKGQFWPKILWTMLAGYILLINYESLYAYQLMWGLHVTEEQAFQGVWRGLTIQFFWNERAILLAMLAMVAAITRHQRAQEAGAYQFERSHVPPAPASPSPKGGNRRSGVPAAEEAERTERAKQAIVALLDRQPRISARDIEGALIQMGMPLSLSTINYERNQYRREHPQLYRTVGKKGAQRRRVA